MFALMVMAIIFRVMVVMSDRVICPFHQYRVFLYKVPRFLMLSFLDVFFKRFILWNGFETKKTFKKN